jgi:excinuclease ABC subunit C
MIGLAKKNEEIIIHKVLSIRGLDEQKLLERAGDLGAYKTDSADFINITLPENSAIVKLLQRIRDESHRFAVSYHSVLKRGRQTKSLLEDFPGIGPTTRKKLLRHFGSMRGVMNAETSEIQAVIGSKKGELLAKYIAAART